MSMIKFYHRGKEYYISTHTANLRRIQDQQNISDKEEFELIQSIEERHRAARNVTMRDIRRINYN